MELYKVRNKISMGENIYDMPLKVTFYARVSTDKDAQLNSLDNQIMYFKNLINENENWTYVDGYIDEGISGSSTYKRENFLNMINDSYKGLFDLILTKEISRFSRSTLDSIKYTQELLANDVGVLFQSDNINTIMPDSELRLTIMSSIAQEEVRKLSERVRFGMKRSIEKGKVLGNDSITGFDKQDGQLIINESESEKIKIIYELYSSGDIGLQTLSKRLFSLGYKNKNGKHIHTTTLRRIITNPKFKGYYCTNTIKKLDYRNKKQIRLPMSEWIVSDSNGKIPKIVTDELWERCNNILNNRTTNYNKNISDKKVFSRKTTYGGLLICADDNLPFKRQVTSFKKVTWTCSGMSKFGKSYCESPIIYEEDLDIIFKNIIDIVLDNKDNLINELSNMYKEINNSFDYEKEIKQNLDDINKINIKKNKLLDLVISEVITSNEYKRRNRELDNEVKLLEDKNIKIEKDKTFDNDINDKLKEINNIIKQELDSKEMYSKIIKLLISKVIVKKIDNNRRNIELRIYTKLFDNNKEIINNLHYDNYETDKTKYKYSLTY